MEIRINHPIRLATGDVHEMLHSREYGQTVRQKGVCASKEGCDGLDRHYIRSQFPPDHGNRRVKQELVELTWSLISL